MIAIKDDGGDYMNKLNYQSDTRVKITLSNGEKLLPILTATELNDLMCALVNAKYFEDNSSIIMDVIDEEDKPCGKSVIFAKEVTLVTFSEV
ncbi:hypothetical protein D3P96_02855 [Weissella viridescens]|uniref:Uncharacterized protein n=1 Tax=Weissella viridescens TaxID=1629 RepID=A0A3P2RCC9_WEIVI|nr:hypothetical protein [Weissella viridescens]RRG18244.1 hypothetical protein D3P96_02855 [Weissella viridescens]